MTNLSAILALLLAIYALMMELTSKNAPLATTIKWTKTRIVIALIHTS